VKELEKAHANHLLPQFNARESTTALSDESTVEILTEEITTVFIHIF
jgi:hypothetical protein